jgi:hypothetical protein
MVSFTLRLKRTELLGFPCVSPDAPSSLAGLMPSRPSEFLLSPSLRLRCVCDIKHIDIVACSLYLIDKRGGENETNKNRTVANRIA